MTEPSKDCIRALVVDDDIETATTFAYLLQLLGCRTATAFGTEMGLRIFRLFQPALCFVDMNMPGADGCAMVQLARALPGTDPDVLFVCLTGETEAREAALAAGFDRFVVKPMPPEVLQEILAEAATRNLRHAAAGPRTS